MDTEAVVHGIYNGMLCCAVLSHSVVSNSFRPHRLWPSPSRLLCPWGFFRQEYSGGLPCSPPGDLPNPGIKPTFPTLQADSSPSEPPGKPQWNITHPQKGTLIRTSFLIRWMNLDTVIQSEISQKKKNKYHILTHIHGI